MSKLKILISHPDRCAGCRRCELWCSLVHFNTQGPDLSAIHVAGQSPTVCFQCGLCLASCPVPGALKRIRKTGAIRVTEKCTGCGHCAAACPYGMITVHPAAGKAIKCDHCGGDPLCARHCPYGALDYVDLHRGAEARRLGGLLFLQKPGAPEV